ncbi:MAG: tetratricopeptide repeat protein [Nitrospirae bacterium]|nr:tetratricopeptide repeat protein [Nitrospirota bacterium]
MKFIHDLISPLHDIAGVIAGYLHIPWAAEYVHYFLAAILLLILFVIAKKILSVLLGVFLRPFQPLRRYFAEKSMNRAEEKVIKRRIKKALTEKDHKTAAQLYQSINAYEKAAVQYLEAEEYASAAEIHEKTGDLEKAALFFQKAGNNTRAAELFLKIQDDKNAALMYEKGRHYLKAAELYEKAGDFMKAAESYEACFIEQRNPVSMEASGSRYALMSGKLYEKAGQYDKAIRIFERARLFYDAAAAHELKGDFLRAGECYLHSGNPEKAAELFGRGGEFRRQHEILSNISYRKGQLQEAALFAEKAGDLLLAAEICMEAGSYLKAGELYAMAGSFNDAAEMYLRGNDFSKAAEAFEKAGNYIPAAEAYQKTGQIDRKVAELYAKGGEYLRAGKHFMQLELIDNALTVLQKIEPESPDYKTASVAIGRIFGQKGMAHLAIEKFNKAINNEPVNRSNLEPYYYLALYYEISGKTDDARTIYNKILAEDYQYMDVSQRVSRLSP